MGESFRAAHSASQGSAQHLRGLPLAPTVQLISSQLRGRIKMAVSSEETADFIKILWEKRGGYLSPLPIISEMLFLNGMCVSWLEI